MLRQDFALQFSVRGVLHLPVIQANLADGRQPVAVAADERQHVRRGVAVENRRVQAGAGPDERVAVSQPDHPLRLRHGFAHAQDRLHAALYGARQHLVQVRGKGCRVQVGVGVDQGQAA